MEQYILKSAIVAEIENKIKKYTLRGEESDFLQDGNAKYWGGVLSCLNEIRSYLDTLEVKEVDLEAKLNTWRHNHFHGGRDFEASGESIERHLQEEPVSKDLEEKLKDYAYQVAYDLSNDWLKENATWDDVETAVKLGAQWQKDHTCFA